MKSTDIAFYIMLAGITIGVISLIVSSYGAYKLFVRNKEEQQASTQRTIDEVSAEVRKKGAESIDSINQNEIRIVGGMDKQAASIKDSLQEKFQQTLVSLDLLNESISSTRGQLSNQLKGIANPLSSFKLEGFLEIDFKEINDGEGLLNIMVNYLEKYENYEAIYDAAWRKKLPQMLIVRYVKGEAGKVRAFANPDCERDQSLVYEKGYDFPFAHYENIFLSAYLPSINFILNTTDKDFSTKDDGDLIYNIDKFEKFTYDIDLIEEKIRINFVAKNPTIYRNKGKINSLYDCSEGIAIMAFQCNKGVKVTPQQIIIAYGSEYKTNVSLRFARDKNDVPIEFVKDDSYSNIQYYYSKGSDMINQLK